MIETISMKFDLKMIGLAAIFIATSIGCNKQQQTINYTPIIIDTTQQNPDTSSRITYNWLALGDSYTIGQSVQPTERFPAQTVSILKSDSIKFSNPIYIATTGWTTTSLINAINQQNPTDTFDLVTLLIGVNDQYQRMDTGGYRTRFTQLLIKAITLAKNNKKRVVVLSIPDYSVTPFVSASDKSRVSKEIDQFNFINKQVTLSYNVAYIDITPSTRQAATDPSLIANDGLHPSGKEYAKWAQLLAPEIKKAIK